MDRWIPNARQQVAGSIHQIKSVRISLDREMQQHEEAGYEWRGNGIEEGDELISPEVSSGA
jgi:hypothetical protein